MAKTPEGLGSPPVIDVSALTRTQLGRELVMFEIETAGGFQIKPHLPQQLPESTSTVPPQASIGRSSLD